MNLIKEKPAPKVPEKIFSNDFADFISCCLDKDPEKRPQAKELLVIYY